MKKLLPAFLLLITFACRKDSSTSVPSTVSNQKCLLLSSISPDGYTTATVKYELDSIVTEIKTTNGNEALKWYLQIENPKQFIFMDGDKSLKNAKTRIYLNDFGSIEKEIVVTLNADGLTLTEDPDQVRLFTYNSKKQLVKVESSIGDQGVYKLTYDSKDRLNRISIQDIFDDEMFVYENFTYLDKPKNDNSFVVAFFESIAMYLIPSIRNVYITGYQINLPLFPALSTEAKYDYTFDKEGNLSAVRNRINTYGAAIDVVTPVKLRCK